MASHANSVATFIRTTLSSPKFAFLRAFFATWLKLDLTTLAAALTIYGTLSGALKDLQGISLKIYWWFTRFFTASISIGSKDRLNREILNWLSTQVLMQQGTRILTARTETITRTDAWSRSEKTTRNDYLQEKRVPIQYLPTFGTTWFIFKRNIFLVRRISPRSVFAQNTPDEYADAPAGDEPLVCMVLGRSVAPIKEFFEECRVFADKQREAFITVRASKNDYGRASWDTTILRPIRPMSTVHFDEKTKDELIADITKYLEPTTRHFYTERGIPYRRGYLLHGPPGTGKTSLSLALSGHYGLELYLCHLPSIKEDNELERLFSGLPPRCIVLLEDIDAISTKRKGHYDRRSEMDKEKDDDEEGSDSDSDDDSYSGDRSRITLSGLLNVLDGVASQEGRIVLMTSNMAHRLDKALVRPGRIDKMIFLGNISSRSAELMFLRMYAPEPPDKSHFMDSADEKLQQRALDFSSHIPDNVFTPAQLQGFLLNRRDSPELAAADIEEWVKNEQKILDDEKRHAKEAAAYRRRKRKEKALAKLTKTLETVAAEDVDAGDADVEEELEKLEKTVKRETEKKNKRTLEKEEGKVKGEGKASEEEKVIVEVESKDDGEEGGESKIDEGVGSKSAEQGGSGHRIAQEGDDGVDEGEKIAPEIVVGKKEEQEVEEK